MGGGYTKEQLLARLRELQIDFNSYNHPSVLTVEAQAKYVGHIEGGLSKNLFLKDKKHRFYVVSTLARTTVDLKVLSQRLGLGKGGLRMAPEEALQEILQVPLGCVTPFALINESAKTVSLLLDQGFKAQECCFFHPLSNDMTICKRETDFLYNVLFRPQVSITEVNIPLKGLVSWKIALNACDLDKFLASVGRNPSYIDLEATPLVGKDQPPDLSDLVPSAVPIVADPSGKAVSVQPSAENHAPIEKKPINFAGGDAKELNEEKGITKKQNNTAASLAGVTNVRELLQEIIEKTTAAVLAEVTKASGEQQTELLGPVLVEVRKRIGSDLENQIMSFKNAAYTEGFHSGIQSLSFRRR